MIDIRTVKRLPDGRFEAIGHDEDGREVRMVTKDSGTTSEWEIVQPEEA